MSNNQKPRLIDADKLLNEIRDLIQIASKYENDFAKGGKNVLERVKAIVESFISEQEPPENG